MSLAIHTHCRQKILIVDDDRTTRMLLGTFLRKRFDIFEASNGQEAIEVFEREQPSLILMDVTMPVMTGYEATAIIKQKSGKRFVPIIFLTALVDDESLAKCVQSGGDDFLSKPIHHVLLEAKITSMLRIAKMHAELEEYKRNTEREIEFSRHVVDALTNRMREVVVPGFDCWNIPVGHFSGDMIVYNVSPTGNLYVMLGDFAGHGFSAATGTLPTSDVFFAMTRRNCKPDEILAEINRKLKEILPVGHFCAATLICCYPGTRSIEIFNGGLPPVLMLDQTNKIKHSVKSTNLALGVLPANLFKAEIVRFEDVSNTTVLVYSDGLTESQNADGEVFGDHGLHGALISGKNPMETTKENLRRFLGDMKPHDDVSLVTLRL